jgi:hypothetical protein
LGLAASNALANAKAFCLHIVEGIVLGYHPCAYQERQDAWALTPVAAASTGF